MKEENENKKSHYIFFIETHEISREFKLSFSSLKVEEGDGLLLYPASVE